MYTISKIQGHGKRHKNYGKVNLLVEYILIEACHAEGLTGENGARGKRSKKK